MTGVRRALRGPLVAVVLGVVVGLGTRCAPTEPGLPTCPRPPAVAHERCAP